MTVLNSQTELNSQTVSSIDSRVYRPGYHRDAVSVGIVHFGVGAFHRAHQAMYLDRMLGLGETRWGICGVGTQLSDRAVGEALSPQDGMYTLITRAPGGTDEVRVIGSIVEYLYAPERAMEVLDRLTDPAVRVVSLTITEGGYGVDDVTGAYDPQDAATIADLDAADSGDTPRSVCGFIVAALRRRRERGIVPFTVMSCDNIPANGDVARAAVRGFARRVDPELAEWINENVTFPSSMVDRITPATTDRTREWLVEEFGIVDRWPVASESFEQWVLEDNFPAGRPPLQRAGVQLVKDVHPYEFMKLRLLNASHQAMSYLGILAGATYVHEICRDPIFARFLRDYMQVEAIPTLQPLPDVDIETYCDTLISRFCSEAISDTLARQVVDGSERIPKFLLPVLGYQLRVGGPIDRCALVLAAWSVFLAGSAEDGTETPIVDVREEALVSAAAEEEVSPGSFLRNAGVFGEMAQDLRLREAFVAARATLKAVGSRAAVEAVAGV